MIPHRGNRQQAQEAEKQLPLHNIQVSGSDRPTSHYRMIVATAVSLISLISVIVVFWLSLLNLIEGKQLLFGLGVFLAMAFIGGVIGNTEVKR
jgi:type IV secretory pathway TrbL component